MHHRVAVYKVLFAVCTNAMEIHSPKNAVIVTKWPPRSVSSMPPLTDTNAMNAWLRAVWELALKLDRRAVEANIALGINLGKILHSRGAKNSCERQKSFWCTKDMCT